MLRPQTSTLLRPSNRTMNENQKGALQLIWTARNNAKCLGSKAHMSINANVQFLLNNKYIEYASNAAGYKLTASGKTAAGISP